MKTSIVVIERLLIGTNRLKNSKPAVMAAFFRFFFLRETSLLSRILNEVCEKAMCLWKTWNILLDVREEMIWICGCGKTEAKLKTALFVNILFKNFRGKLLESHEILYWLKCTPRVKLNSIFLNADVLSFH